MPVWAEIEDKTQDWTLWSKLGMLLRWASTYPVLIWRFIRAPRPDLVLTSFPGILDTILIVPIARLRGVPVVWDLFISAYDTLVFDRALVPQDGAGARLLRWIEGRAIRSADLVLLDTETHARRIEELFRLLPGTCESVPVGAEVEQFAPVPATPPRAEPLQVLFYGQFIPLHGIETIIHAAEILRDEDIEWTLIGQGQVAAAIREMLDADPLPKLTWIDWVEYGELNRRIAGADLCLGVFGTSEKAASVIPNKVYQTLACGRPLITRDSPAIRELLEHAPPCVYLVPPDDPHALADTIRTHARARYAVPIPACHAALRDQITPLAVAGRFRDLVARRLTPSA